MLKVANCGTWSFEWCRSNESGEKTSAGCLPFKCQQRHYWGLAWQRRYKDILTAVQTAASRQRFYKAAVATRQRSWVKENTSIYQDNGPTNIRRCRKVLRRWPSCRLLPAQSFSVWATAGAATVFTLLHNKVSEAGGRRHFRLHHKTNRHSGDSLGIFSSGAAPRSGLRKGNGWLIYWFIGSPLAITTVQAKTKTHSIRVEQQNKTTQLCGPSFVNRVCHKIWSTREHTTWAFITIFSPNSWIRGCVTSYQTTWGQCTCGCSAFYFVKVKEANDQTRNHQ